MDSNHVAHQNLAEPGSQRRGKVSHLIGVRQHHIGRIDLLHQLLQSDDVAIGRVVLQQGVLHREYPGQLLAPEFSTKPINTRADHSRRAVHAKLRRQLLARCQSFEAHAVPRPTALLHQYENTVHITLTSNFSFSTIFAATSAGVPVSISVFFCFSGRYTRSSAIAGPVAEAVACTVLVSFVLAFLIPISVAYRSLLPPDWIVSSAGSGISTCWNHPSSSSRFTFNPEPTTSTCMMMVACGIPSSSASTTPVCPSPRSSDCSPVRIRSAALASASRSVLVTRSGPAHTTTTSPLPFFSLSCNASSRA